MVAILRKQTPATGYSLTGRTAPAKKVRFAAPLALAMGEATLHDHMARLPAGFAPQSAAWHGHMARNVAWGVLRAMPLDPHRGRIAVVTLGQDMGQRIHDARLWPSAWAHAAPRCLMVYTARPKGPVPRPATVNADWAWYYAALSVLWLMGRYGDAAQWALGLSTTIITWQTYAAVEAHGLRTGIVAGLILGLSFASGAARHGVEALRAQASQAPVGTPA
jgi:hypothetical protein